MAATPTGGDTQFRIIPNTGTETLDALLGQTKWGAGIPGSPVTLTYSFPTGTAFFLSSGYTEFESWQAFDITQSAQARAALQSWANVANVTFVETVDNESVVGDLRFTRFNGSTDQVAHAYGPGGTFDVATGVGFAAPRAGDVWIDFNDASNTVPTPGTYGFATLVHEIGHALGLKHPFEAQGSHSTTLSGNEDVTHNTVMSYSAYPGGSGIQWTFMPTTPMPLDIRAAQYLYGANTAFHAGDDVYTYFQGEDYFETIWDAGGNDTIVYSGSDNAEIDLRPGAFSNLGNSLVTTDLAQTSDYTVVIYDTVIIENATGGNGPDVIYGNDVNNSLRGGSGDDTIFGYGGNDDIAGGPGDDYLAGTEGNDRFDWDPASRAGNDAMHGEAGDDTYVIDTLSDLVVEAAGEGTDTIWSAQSYSLALLPDVENLFLFGPDAADAVGNARNNLLAGTAGDNLLDGGAGVDAAVYSWMYRQHQVTGSPGGVGGIDGPEGADSVMSIEALRFLDGVMHYDAMASIWRVDRLYEATLERHGDPLGLNNWATLVDNGVVLSTVAIGFTDSVEFQANYGSLDNSAFVNQLYLNVLDRAADPDGLANWVNYLNGGATRGQVVVGFSESQEFVNSHAAQLAAGRWDIDETAGSVARLYWGTLDRAPESQGLSNWVSFLKTGQYTLPQAAEGFTGSLEFQSVYGPLDDNAFVNQLYLNVLERSADPEGLENWTGFLAGGMTRGQVALGFTESQEFQINMIGLIDGGIQAVDAVFIP